MDKIYLIIKREDIQERKAWDKGRILLLMDALILCTDMISQAVYQLANRDYWRYKYGRRADDPEIAGIIDYIDREKRIDLISYDFVKEYQALPENSFSEFETYGTYVALKYPEAYRL